MRIDKFLKVSRIIKRRTVAKDLCDGGKVEINDKIAKAGDSVKVDDRITVTFGEKKLKVKVIGVDERKKPEELYEVG
ncbi:MAG: RNA-binding S4 domain-containing protein [Bacillota bacterium]|nr:RNA-binding S4 domain-containing protein [Bacillota bacterium]